jgi:hypothetical protein
MDAQLLIKERLALKERTVRRTNVSLKRPSPKTSQEIRANPVHRQQDWQNAGRSARMWGTMLLAAGIFWIGIGIILLNTVGS